MTRRQSGWSAQALRELRYDAMLDLADAEWTYADIGRVIGIKNGQHIRRIIPRWREIRRRIREEIVKQNIRTPAPCA